MASTILPERATALRAEGLDKAESAAHMAFRAAWPHRAESFRASVVVRANLATLRDVRTLRTEV